MAVHTIIYLFRHSGRTQIQNANTNRAYRTKTSKNNERRNRQYRTEQQTKRESTNASTRRVYKKFKTTHCSKFRTDGQSKREQVASFYVRSQAN